jgi:sterol desaturase/sphingolipid hydroxylase (fatty acid hydroxylase superfamily)
MLNRVYAFMTMPDDLGLMSTLFQQLSQLIHASTKSFVFLFFPFIDPTNRLYWFHSIGSLCLFLGFYYFRQARQSGFSLTKAMAYCFPLSLYNSPSAILDYQCYVINGLFKILVSLTSFFSLSEITSAGVSQFMMNLLGRSGIEVELTFSLKLLFTLLAVLVLDFSAFYSHYLLHKVPFLWEFHKVHHAAEGLTPITGFRDHPVDVAFKQTLRAAFFGVFLGISSYIINDKIVPITAGGLIISTFLFRFIINLRHSHVWITFSWPLSHIFCSPAMHQIHHSKDPAHIDKNFALIFSVWDYLFQTLYIPRSKEEFEIGIVGQGDYETIWSLYLTPFVEVYDRVKGVDVYGIVNPRQTGLSLDGSASRGPSQRP